MIDMDAPFPINWDEWRTLWKQWFTQAQPHLGTTRERIPGKNFLADNVLGTWLIKGEVVELSEVTFPDFTSGSSWRDRNRFVGITIKDRDLEGRGIVHNFGELEMALGISTAVQEHDEDVPIHFGGMDRSQSMGRAPGGPRPLPPGWGGE